MREGFIARGFRGRRKPGDQSGRLPLGQYLERGFPVVLATWSICSRLMRGKYKPKAHDCSGSR
jgi:hypothetical protein